MSYKNEYNLDLDILLDVINEFYKKLKKRNVKNSFIDIIKIGFNVIDNFNIHENAKTVYLIQSIKIIIQDNNTKENIVFGEKKQLLINDEVIKKIILLYENNIFDEILELIQYFRIKKHNKCTCNIS